MFKNNLIVKPKVIIATLVARYKYILNPNEDINNNNIYSLGKGNGTIDEPHFVEFKLEYKHNGETFLHTRIFKEENELFEMLQYIMDNACSEAWCNLNRNELFRLCGERQLTRNDFAYNQLRTLSMMYNNHIYTSVDCIDTLCEDESYCLIIKEDDDNEQQKNNCS